MFTRSLVPFKRKGIRINVLCPEVRRYVEEFYQCFPMFQKYNLERVNIFNHQYMIAKRDTHKIYEIMSDMLIVAS